jgi:ABC-type amino acid transport substrate-binding protein
MEGVDSGTLSENVKKGLQVIKNKGTYQDIVARYYGKDAT